MQLGPELHAYNASASQGTNPEKDYPAGITVRLHATWYQTGGYWAFLFFRHAGDVSFEE
jgi:hypothetical protein